MALAHQVYAADQVNIGIILQDLMKELRAPLVLGGFLATLFGLGQVVGSNPAGWLVERKGISLSLLLGLFTFSLFTLLTGLSLGYWDAGLYRVGLGLGQAVWNVAFFSYVGTLFAGRRGLGMAILPLNYPIGIVWGAPATALIAVWWGSWRAPFYLFGLFGFLVLVFLILAIRSIAPRPIDTKMAVSIKYYLSVLRTRNVTLGSLVALFYGLNFASILALYPTYLRSVVMFDPITAGTVMSLQMWVPIILAPFVLILSDKFGRKPFLSSFGLVAAFSLYLMFHIPPEDFSSAALANLLYGVSGAGTFALIVAFMQDSVPHERVGVATGLANFFIYVGVTVAGPISGFITSLLGWAMTSLWLIFLSVGLFMAAFLSK